ncbi:hypothetical protein [Erwinia sp. CGal63]|uniref:hypothetical protein n=1 Tax=Erwinia sp. CGal63 TaxID=2919889 RepID=UPI003008583A
MFRLPVAAALVACSFFAHASNSAAPPQNSEYQITCPGRPTMTVTSAQYGLTTLLWAGDHFQVAAGSQRSHTDNGDSVAIILFRNGDQMVTNKNTDETFFSYNGQKHLVSCSRTSEREKSTVTLQRTDAAGKVES